MGPRSRRVIAALAFAALLATPASAASILFDATKHEMGGNADWVIDADAWNLNLPAYPCTGSTNESNPARVPTPAQSGIGPTTAETYWTGAISSWGVDLVKAGHTVETLPPGGRITFGDGTNPQDLSNYKIFVVVEPQNPFTTDEKTAILAFVAAGGGLFMVGDHETSDRDCDGWDSPHVWNDLTGATSATSAGVFGIWMRVNGLDDQGGEDWFDDATDANVETSLADPIVNGPFGSGAGGLGLFGSTSMDLNPADNATVTGHVWRTGQAHGNLRVTFATASYGTGRVAAIGDSSPADDGTGDSGDNLYGGWDKATGGVKNREIHLNACAWLLNPPPDTTPPAIAAGPAASARDCSAVVTWTTDEGATSIVDYGPTAGYGSVASVAGYVQEHAVPLSPLAPSTEYHYRASSSDVHGNGPTESADASFSTTAAASPSILSGPAVASVTGTGAVVAWTTDEPSTSEVQYGTTASYGSVASAAGSVASHSVALSGLTPETLYHYRVASTDPCGQGPTLSSDATFTTGPNARDLSGWTIKQYTSAQTFTIPSGTSIPSGGYVVVGRNATLAEFQATFPSMPAATVYLNSNANGSCSAGCFPLINGDETFELYDALGARVDGPTVAMASTHSAYQRINPGDPAGSASSWSVVAESLASPGQGVGASSGSGVRILEMADAADYNREFVELYWDAGSSAPDTVAPARVADLAAYPVSASGVRLAWTATGDDGTTGTATSYDVRMSAARILTEADFEAATALAGEPAPKAAGSAEQFTVGGLAADTPYHFAMKVSDERPNVSALSNSASATTALAGGSTPVAHLVISQLQIAGTTDDVVELYNPTDAAVSLSGHSVQYLAANGNFGFRSNLTGTNSVPSHGWYLVAANGYAGSPARDDSLGTLNMSGSAGHALLVSKTTNASGCTDAAIVDKVGYGASATCPEGGSGHHAFAPGSALSISRRPGGRTAGSGQDTDANDADFSSPATPAWNNRLSAPATPPSALGNVGATLYLSKGASGTALEWANAAGASGYHVYRGTAAGFMGSSPAPWTSPAVNGAVDADVPASVFFYVVRATDGTSDSAN